MVSSLVRSRLGGLRLTGMVSSLIASPFHRKIRSARPLSWSRWMVMLTSSSRVRSNCLRSLSVVAGASQTCPRSSPRARIAAILAIPARAWTPPYDTGGQVRDGAWVAELTGLLTLTSWPKGMRVIVRKERPHPGAQLRFTDIDGHRFTCFATSARTGQLADLELRHRHRARCEDRIRNAKDTGLHNLPLHGYDQNQLWSGLVALACELLARMAMLALTGATRRWEPKRLRLRLFSAAGRLVRGGRRHRCACQPAGPGRSRSPARSVGFRPLAPSWSALPGPTTRKDTCGPVEPPTRRDSRAAGHDRALKNSASRSLKPPSQDRG